MARIPLTSGFNLMPEGKHIFKIQEAVYKEEFGKIKITLVTPDGKKHFENFTLFNDKGEANDGACNAFSALARAALRDFDVEDIDPQELEDCYIKGYITYRTYTDKNGNTRKTTQKEPGTWWESISDEEVTEYESNIKHDAPSETNGATDTNKPVVKYDLNALLGR